jgi:acyl carrier protein
MTRHEVFEAVVQAIKAVQGASGRTSEKITGTTRPIGQLAGFDSHAGLEFTCAVEQAFEIKVSMDENLCVNDAENRAKTIDEIVDRIIEIQKGT